MIRNDMKKYVYPYRFPISYGYFNSLDFPFGWMRVETLKKKLKDKEFTKKFNKEEIEILNKIEE